jgi:hypothetical protein
MRNLRGGVAALATGLLILAFATPVRVLWAQSGLDWWAPFVIWAAAIAALAVAGGASDDGRNAP